MEFYSQNILTNILLLFSNAHIFHITFYIILLLSRNDHLHLINGKQYTQQNVLKFLNRTRERAISVSQLIVIVFNSN